MKNNSAYFNKVKGLLCLLFLFGSATVRAQQQIPLYPGRIPNAKQNIDRETAKKDLVVDTVVSHVSRPTLSIFLPPKGKANGTAVIIFPGGGYGVLLTKREGSDVAREFVKLGIAAFVVKYRLPDSSIMVDPGIGPLQDAQQAIRIVRGRAAEWGINQDRIGVMGFSAGGHLASTVGTHFYKPVIDKEESQAKSNEGETQKNRSLRPDFMLLINPVISFTDSIGHRGSRFNLLGQSPSPEQILYFSNEYQVKADTPPAFLVHSGADSVVPVSNSIQFYEALRRNKIPAGMHIYSKGEHGFLTGPSFEEWFGRCIYWMKEMNLKP
ncbi:alpha/beta hydrolase [Flavitalea flava]